MGKTKQPNKSKKCKFIKKTWSSKSVANALHEIRSCKSIRSSVKKYIINPLNDDRPGKDWLHNFMKQQKLSTKKATIISAARKADTANPFIIFDFYEVAEKIIKEKKLKRK